MATAKKLTRRELKEPDEFITLWSRIVEYVSSNRQKVLVWAGCVLALVLVGWGISAYLQQREQRASTLLGEAQAHLRLPVPVSEDGSPLATEPTRDPEQEAKAIETLEDLVDRYGSTHASLVGRLLLGDLLYRRGEMDGALRMYREIIDKAGQTSELAALAWKGMTYAQEEKGEYTQALASYERVAHSRLTYLQGWGWLGVARCQEKLGEADKALDSYRRLLSEYPQHPRAAEAKASIARIQQTLGGSSGAVEEGAPASD